MSKLASLLLAAVAVLGLARSATAAEWGVVPLPKHLLSAQLPDLLDAVTKVRSVKSGVNVTMVGWHEMEPKKGTYTIEQRLGGISYMEKLGMKPYFGINVINTTTRDMPDDLVNTSWQAPEMIERFRQLVLKTKGYLPTNLPYFIIGNEVDAFFENHPDELEYYLAFYQQAKTIVKELYPSAKIGMSVTYDGLRRGRGKLIEQVVAASDAAFFTFYPMQDMKPLPPEQTPALLDDIVAVAQGKPVLLQEVGYSSSTVLGSSQEKQAEFFDMIIPAINARPQIVLADIFALYDFEPAFCDKLVPYYGASGWPEELRASFKEFLCSLGVFDNDDKPKAAWAVIGRQLAGH